MENTNEKPKCGCGQTNDPSGYCDGSHNNITDKYMEDTSTTIGINIVKNN